MTLISHDEDTIKVHVLHPQHPPTASSISHNPTSHNNSSAVRGFYPPPAVAAQTTAEEPPAGRIATSAGTTLINEQQGFRLQLLAEAVLPPECSGLDLSCCCCLGDGPLLAVQLSPAQLLLLSPCLDSTEQQQPAGAGEPVGGAAAAAGRAAAEALGGVETPSRADHATFPSVLGFDAPWDALVLDLTADTLVEMLCSHAKKQQQQQQQCVAAGSRYQQQQQQLEEEGELIALLSKAAAAPLNWQLLQSQLVGRCIHLYCTVAVQLSPQPPQQWQRQHQQQQQQQQYQQQQQQLLCCKLVLQLDQQQLEVDWVQAVAMEDVSAHALLQLPPHHHHQQQNVNSYEQQEQKEEQQQQQMWQKCLRNSGGSRRGYGGVPGLLLGSEPVLTLGSSSGKVVLLRECSGKCGAW